MNRYVGKKMLFFTLLLTLLTSLIFTPAAVAEPSGGGTNAAPVIVLGDVASLTTAENTAVSINLKAADANKDTMTWFIINNGPANGTAETSNITNRRGTSTADVSYTPRTGYNGADSFVVKVQDPKLAFDTILINVSVTPDQVIMDISYVALGDSIATGTVYPGKVITSYVTYFYQYLQEQNSAATVTKSSFAADGDRTNELYDKLGIAGTGDSALITAVENADIITLSIGGNNLMQAAKDDSALGGYNFNHIDIAVAEQGLADFQIHWIPIIQKIRHLNPDVQLITTTTYNPYNETDTDLHNTVDSYLTRLDRSGLNDLILDNTSLGYSITNVYQNFNDNYKNNMGAVTYFYPTDFWGMLIRNPHPNAVGQGIITDLCELAYTSID